MQAGPYLDFATALNARPPDGATFRPDLEDQLVGLANAYRKGQGKAPVAADPMFRAAARAHAADMMVNGFMGHTSSNGYNFEGRMMAFGAEPGKFSSLAENAARDTQKTPVGPEKARALFSQWVKSPPHRAALVSRNYQFVSTGVIQRGDKIWAVQIFFSAPRQQGLFQSSSNGTIGLPLAGAAPSQGVSPSQ